MSYERRMVSCNGTSNICRMCELKEPHTTTQIDTHWWFCDTIHKKVRSEEVKEE